LVSYGSRRGCHPLKFAVVIACPFGFPQFIGFGVEVFSKVGASVGVGTCGMHGAD